MISPDKEDYTYAKRYFTLLGGNSNTIYFNNSMDY